MAPRTSSRGATPGPKVAARATIHSTIATVKIVQNTALPPDRVLTSNTSKPGYELRRLQDRCGQRLRFGETIQVAHPTRSSDPISIRRVVCALVRKGHRRNRRVGHN